MGEEDPEHLLTRIWQQLLSVSAVRDGLPLLRVAERSILAFNELNEQVQKRVD